MRRRSDRALPRILLLLAAGLLLNSGCGSRAVTTQTYDEVDDSWSQSTTFESEDDFQRAGRLVRERDFGGAIEIYRRLYRNAPETDTRARALLRWAEAEGSLLNPDRDLDQAIARLELLLEEFDDATVRQEAQERLERLRGLRDQTPR